MNFVATEEPFRTINKKLGKGWMCGLQSEVTPGIVRLQLMSVGKERYWRKCVEAPTLDEAIREAIRFTKTVTVQQWENRMAAERN